MIKPGERHSEEQKVLITSLIDFVCQGNCVETGMLKETKARETFKRPDIEHTPLQPRHQLVQRNPPSHSIRISFMETDPHLKLFLRFCLSLHWIISSATRIWPGFISDNAPEEIALGAIELRGLGSGRGIRILFLPIVITKNVIALFKSSQWAGHSRAARISCLLRFRLAAERFFLIFLVKDLSYSVSHRQR